MRPQTGEKPRVRLRKRLWQLDGGRRRRRMRVDPARSGGANGSIARLLSADGSDIVMRDVTGSASGIGNDDGLSRN